jgi:hypothetical protein
MGRTALMKPRFLLSSTCLDNFRYIRVPKLTLYIIGYNKRYKFPHTLERHSFALMEAE